MIESESVQDRLLCIAEEPYPCEGCALWDHCRDTQEECKAFRNYTGTINGSFDLNDRGRLMRVPRYLR